MKIYTRTGDRGETGLPGGVRVSKDHTAIDACGELDATNSQLGLARSHGLSEQVDRVIVVIQEDLFVLGSQVAASLATETRAIPALPKNRIAELEELIDRFDAELTPMDSFILPGGSVPGAQLHVARTVCRRAERCLVKLTQDLQPNQDLVDAIIYLNRLSDLLFVLARFVNLANQSPESKWLPGHQ